SVVNPGQSNVDGDAAGDACDVCPGDALNDQDDDGICAGAGYRAPKDGDHDNCPVVANSSQTDADLDGAGDACDNCPTVVNASQTNSDTDTLGDACDDCPTVANQAQTNA